MNGRYSKLAFLHRVKERKTPSLSAQASFAPFFLKVAWSGKSLIQNPGDNLLISKIHVSASHIFFKSCIRHCNRNDIRYLRHMNA